MLGLALMVPKMSALSLYLWAVASRTMAAMRTLVQRLVLVAAVAALVACGGADGPRVYGTSSRDLRVKQGASVVLELESNISTGYSWQMAALPDTTVVRIVDEHYVAPNGDAVGAGGKQRFTLESVGIGATSIRLQYVRPWEQPLQPTQEVTYAVVVTDS